MKKEHVFRKNTHRRVRKCIETIQKSNNSKATKTNIETNTQSTNPIDPRDIITNPWTSESTWYPKSKLKELCVRALEFVKSNPRCITMGTVEIEMDIPHDKWMDWIDRYDFFSEMNKQCIRIISTRRETGMAMKEMSERSTMYMMHNYDKDWDASNRYWAEFRKNEQLQLAKGSFVVEMQESPRTDEVPERKIELIEVKNEPEAI